MIIKSTKNQCAGSSSASYLKNTCVNLIFEILCYVSDGVFCLVRYSAVGKIASGHQAPIICLSIHHDSQGTENLITGSKDHLIKLFDLSNAQSSNCLDTMTGCSVWPIEVTLCSVALGTCASRSGISMDPRYNLRSA